MSFDADEWNDTEALHSSDPFELNDESSHKPHPVLQDESLVPLTPEGVEPLPADFEAPEAIIQNVVTSVNLGTELDLRKIAISARNVEYNPVKVNAVCTGLLFRSGRMMVTGAKSVESARIGGKKMAKLCLKVGHSNVRFCRFRVENIIASADVGFPIRLEGLAHDHSSFCNYEPELFAGLVYRFLLGNAKAVLLIFVSGKVIITGCQTSDMVNYILRTIYPVLAQYRK